MIPKKAITAFLSLGIFLFGGSVFAGSPVAVSPGNAREVAFINQECPTFSWSSAEDAVSYRVEVFEMARGKIVSYEKTAGLSAAVVSAEIEAPALSWTPSVGECLGMGVRYVWYVGGIDSAGIVSWSEGRMFEVGISVSSGVKEAMKEYLEKEWILTESYREMKEVITNEVAKEIATGGNKDQVGRNTVQPLGYEGPTNTFYGQGAGASVTSGTNDTFIGAGAGYNCNSGVGNIFLGYRAGYNEMNSNKLYIANSETDTPLIYGEFDNRILTIYGNLDVIGPDDGLVRLYNVTTDNTPKVSRMVLGHYTNSQLPVYLIGAASTATDNFVAVGGGNTIGNAATQIDLFTAPGTTTPVGKPRLTIKGNGYVGIGTTRPERELEVTASDEGFIRITGDRMRHGESVGSLEFHNSQSGAVIGKISTVVQDDFPENGQMRFYSSLLGTLNSPSIVIYDTGTVGIGTTAPPGLQQLSVNGSIFLTRKSDSPGAHSDTLLVFGDESEGGLKHIVMRRTETGNDFAVDTWSGREWLTRFLINCISGYVGIGTQSPLYPLEMASGAYVTTGGVWTNASSRDYKDNIEALATEEALDTLKELNPVKFAYKRDGTEKHVGFIAEEVPQLIATKDRKGLSPMDIVAVLTKVVQEQQRTISVLSEKVSELERASR